MLLEHDRIALTADIPDKSLKAGDVGSIVHIYPQRAAYEVEFFPAGRKYGGSSYGPARKRPPRNHARHYPRPQRQHSRLIFTSATVAG